MATSEGKAEGIAEPVAEKEVSSAGGDVDAAPKQVKEGEKDEADRKEEKLKARLVISGLVLAVIGVIFAVAKNIKKP